MTAFVIACAVMLAAGLLWLLAPLARSSASSGETPLARQRAMTIAIAVLLPILAIGMYAAFSTWNWQAVEQETAQNAELDSMLQALEARLAENPQDVQGWLLLGRSNTAMGRFGRAAEAFERAYELTGGENLEALLGLGEALALGDDATLAGRAGELFDAALAKAPNNPKALWYGSMAALGRGDLRAGRDRLQSLLAQNPPEEVRGLIERQVQDLNQQLGEAGQPPAAGSAGAQPQRSLRVAVSIAPGVREQLREPLPMFVLARDPAGGPPLAVQRLSSSAAPLTVELSERDAMIAGRTIASVPRVQVVARISRSGTPQEQSGDFYGVVEHDFASEGGTLNVVIDQTVP